MFTNIKSKVILIESRFGKVASKTMNTLVLLAELQQQCGDWYNIYIHANLAATFAPIKACMRSLDTVSRYIVASLSDPNVGTSHTQLLYCTIKTTPVY